MQDAHLTVHNPTNFKYLIFRTVALHQADAKTMNTVRCPVLFLFNPEHVLIHFDKPC